MDKAELMQKEIENKRKLPEEVKKEIKKTIFHNILIAMIIVLYLCAINILFYQLEQSAFEQQMKFFALGLICITVIVFEIAYQRNSKRTGIIGIELLSCSVISLYIPYIYLFTDVNLKMITTLLPMSIAWYYIIKAIIIYKSGTIKYQNNLSDVKEILKDTEKRGYLDEESKKSYREIKSQEEKNQQELLIEQKKIAEANKKRVPKNNRTAKVNQNSKLNPKKDKTDVNTKSKKKTSIKTESKNKENTKKKNRNLE